MVIEKKSCLEASSANAKQRIIVIYALTMMTS